MLADVLRRPKKSATGVGVYVGNIVAPSVTGNQDYSLPAGCPDLSSAPAGSWALMVWTSGSDQASGTFDSNIFSSLGYAANGGGSVSQGCCGTAHGDGTATASFGTSESRRMVAAIATQVWATTVEAEATFVSFPSSGLMRWNWSAASSPGTGTAVKFNYMILTGLTNSKVVQWTLPTTVSSKAVTGVGFKPDLVLHAMSGTGGSAVPATTGYASLVLGAMNKHGQQWSNSVLSANGVTPANTSRWQQTDACLAQVWPSETLLYQAHFQSMDSDGFTTYFSTVDPGAAYCFSLCIGGVSSKIGSFVGPSTPSSKSVPWSKAAGFSPKGLLLSSFGGSPTSAPASVATLEIGATDGTNQRVSSFSDDDAVTTTNAKPLWRNDSISSHVYHSTEYDLAVFSSWSTTIFTLSWSAATGIEYLYLLIGDSGTDTFPVTIVGAGA